MASASSRETLMRLPPRVAQPRPSTVTAREVRPILRVSKAGMSCLLSSCQAVFYIRGYDRIRRRRVGAGGRVAKDQHITAHSAATPSLTDYTLTKGEVSLAVYRKRMDAPAADKAPRPVLFLVHGSSNPALSSFDLTVPGGGQYSTMNVFATLGFDVWTADHENYGRSA